MASSGDLLADRRYSYAEAAFEENDFVPAADLARQALELAPGFAAAWFLLGKALSGQAAKDQDVEARGDAVAAFKQALALQPDDELGAGIRLAALGAADPEHAMSAAYVRALFDEYAIRFDRHLRASLAYRAPELLHDAVRRACSVRLRPFRFGDVNDLGCGTGLAGEAFRPQSRRLTGVDLSPAMVKRAEGKRLYDELAVGPLLPWLEARPLAGADLVLAADVFVYVADLEPVFGAATRALRPDGLFAFTVQTHGREGVLLGEDGRYAHGEGYLRDLAAARGFAVVLLEDAVTRRDRGADVPGLVLVLSPSPGKAPRSHGRLDRASA